jgi:cytochrome c553
MRSMSLLKCVLKLGVLACLLCVTAGFPMRAAAAQGGVEVDGGMRSRVLACTACHGLEGRATPLGYYPRIAGKPAGYLYQQLLNFRDGRRSYPQMAYLLEHLTDAYLQEMAAHFAQLDVPYAAPPALQLPGTTLDKGRRLVERGDAARGIPACVQCHGASLTGVAPSVPGLLGLPRDYLNSQLGAWTTGQRRAAAPDCMARIAQSMTPEDVSAVSGWLAVQPVPGRGRPAVTFDAPLPMRCGGVDGPVRDVRP